MVGEDFITWEIEPNVNFLNIHSFFRAIHKVLWQHFEKPNEIGPNFFQLTHTEGGLSVEWSKYASPFDTLNRRTPQNNLEENGICELNVGEFRNCIKENNFSLDFRHNPLPDNRAHSLIEGFSKQNYTPIRRKLQRITKWAEGFVPVHLQLRS